MTGAERENCLCENVETKHIVFGLEFSCFRVVGSHGHEQNTIRDQTSCCHHFEDTHFFF